MVARRARGVPAAGQGAPRLFRKDDRGTITIEFALLAVPFFFVVFCILETAFLFIADMTLDDAVAKASRTVRTGEVATASLSEEDFRTALCANIELLLSCDDIHVDLRSYSDFASLPDRAPIADGRLDAGGFHFERGKAGQIMALRAFYEFPLYTNIVHRALSNLDGGRHLLASVAVFKTEPF